MGRKRAEPLLPLTSEQQALVVNNLPLVHWWCRRLEPFCEEAQSRATLGLIRAAQDYDPGRGAKFSIYATWWIRAGLQAYRRNRVRQRAVCFTDLNGQLPEPPVRQQPEEGGLWDLVRRLLPERHYQVLVLLFSKDLTHREAGQVLDISDTRVGQIRAVALAKLREHLTERTTMPERVYTSGEVAKHLGVAPRTVRMWLDRGKLKGFRLPPGQQYRITHSELVRFCLEYGLEPPAEGDDQ